jgi:cysteine synthase A
MEQYDNSRIRGLSALIGNTPLLAIDFMFQGRRRTIHAKAENLNMTGSIKDRMALHIMAKGYTKGLLKRVISLPRQPAATQAFHSLRSAARSGIR